MFPPGNRINRGECQSEKRHVPEKTGTCLEQASQRFGPEVCQQGHSTGPLHQAPANGCLAVFFLASISLAEGSPFIARAMASLVAS